MITDFRNATPSIGYANGSAKVPKKTLSQFISDFADDRNTGVNQKITRSALFNAIEKKDKVKCRQYSQIMYSKNPVYFRLIEYMANILCFYWVTYPSFFLQLDKQEEEITRMWMNSILYLEKINPEVLGREILEKCLINGEIYFAVKEKVTNEKATAFGIQELPIDYCRSIKKFNGRDVVEINLSYFDSIKPEQLDEVLKSYPSFLTKLIQNREQCPVDPATRGRWAVISPDYAFHFSLKKDNLPFFIGVILDLLDLQDAKDINMFKMEQQLSRLLALEFPLDSNDTPVFDDEEITFYHNEIVNLLSQVPGLEVISTMAKVKDVDLSDAGQGKNVDILKNQYDNVYSSAGISSKLMSADNAGTLNSSVIVDSSILFKFLNKFNDFLTVQIAKIFGENSITVHMPPVTFFNQKEKADYYMKQSNYGYSKFLPAVCLGQRQSLILSTAWFESQVLQMQKIMIPNASANTIATKDVIGDDNPRHTKEAEERSEKTEKNRESLEGE